MATTFWLRALGATVAAVGIGIGLAPGAAAADDGAGTTGAGSSSASSQSSSSSSADSSAGSSSATDPAPHSEKSAGSSSRNVASTSAAATAHDDEDSSSPAEADTADDTEKTPVTASTSDADVDADVAVEPAADEPDDRDTAGDVEVPATADEPLPAQHAGSSDEAKQTASSGNNASPVVSPAVPEPEPDAAPAPVTEVDQGIAAIRSLAAPVANAPPARGPLATVVFNMLTGLGILPSTDAQPAASATPASAPSTSGVTGVQVGHSTLTIPVGNNGFKAKADWYFPTQADGTISAAGVIWLQHGFLANKSYYSALATTLAQQTNSIVVAPTLPSFALRCSGCSLSGTQMQQAAATLFLGSRTALNASAGAAGYQGSLPDSFVLTGHSAGGGFAAAMGGYYVADLQPTDTNRLTGVVMFDGVSQTSTLDTAIANLDRDDVPIYQIAAPAQIWNAFGATTKQLLALRPDQFDGVVVVGGSHVDSMLGSNPIVDFVAQLVTKFSPAGNTAAVYTLATGWINDFYTVGAGPADPQYGFYGSAGQPIILGQAAAVVLPNQSNSVPSTTPALTNGVTGVKVGHSKLQIPVGTGVYSGAADWYFPTQADGTIQAQGVIWLQHGFLGASSWYSALAEQQAAQTNSIVVVPNIPSFPFFTCNGCSLNSVAMQRGVAALFTDPSRASLNISANQAGYSGVLPETFVLTGHSAGGALATAAGGFYTAAVSAEDNNLLGVVMFDGVSSNGTFAPALDELGDIPVYQIAAPPQAWNANGQTTKDLVALRPDQFVGVTLANGSHVDSLIGGNLLADLASQLFVKRSPAGNTDAVYTLAGGWINDMYAGRGPADPLYGIYGQPDQYIVMGQTAAVVLGAAPVVDVDQYLGTWYEVGSVKQFFSIGLVNTTAVYSPNTDGSIKVVNSGNYFFDNGPKSTIVGNAVSVDPDNNKLNVSFLGPASATPPGNYWIVDLAPDYSWAIVSDRSGGTGFLLSRTRTVSDELYQELLDRASVKGVKRWITPTRQPAAAAATVAV